VPALSIHITGSVQGVFFRVHTKEKAEELGITGWVKNAPDGFVEIHAEGTAKALKELEAWCQHGPSTSRVDCVESKNAKDQECDSFNIRP